MVFWIFFSEKIRMSCFSCVCWPFNYLLWKNVFPYFLPIFVWVIIMLLLSYKSSYLLHTSFLSILFAKIFSHLYFFFICWWTLKPSILKFDEVKFLSFFFCYFGISNNLEPNTRLQKLCLMSSMIFIVLVFAFRSLIRFELLFVYSMR